MAKKGKVNKNAVIEINHWRKFYYVITIILIGLVFLVHSVFYGEKTTTYAQVAKFAPASCLGGWQNPSLVTTSEEAGLFETKYNEVNSAVYQDNLSPLYCGDFLGQLPPQTYHTRVTLHFSWYQETINPVILQSDLEAEKVVEEEKEKSDSLGEVKEISVDTSSSSAVFDFASSSSLTEASTTTINEVSTTTQGDISTTSTKSNSDPEQNNSENSTTTEEFKVEKNEAPYPKETEIETNEESVTAPDSENDTPEPEAESEIPSETPTVEESVNTEASSFWSLWWIKEALANEIENSDVEDGVSTTTKEDLVVDPIIQSVVEEVATTSISETSTKANPPAGAQFSVEYTLDGKNWSVLGYVSEITNDLRFEFPKSALPTIADVKRVQIALIPLLQIDTVPPVYLESLYLEVTYAPVGELGISEVLSYAGEVVAFSDIEIITKSDLASSTLNTTGTSTASELVSTEFTFATTSMETQVEEEMVVNVEVPEDALLVFETEVEAIEELVLATDTDLPLAVTETELASSTKEGEDTAEESVTVVEDEIVLPVEAAATSTKLILPIAEIVDIHGLDRTYALMTRAIGTTTRELWLLDFTTRTATNLTLGDITIGFYPVAVKDRIIFWYSATYDRIFAYDLRTAGTLHALNIVGNLPETEAPYRFTFPFTSWELIAKDQQFVFYSKNTGEVFSDEDSIGTKEFLEKFALLNRLSAEEANAIGASGLITYYE